VSPRLAKFLVYSEDPGIELELVNAAKQQQAAAQISVALLGSDDLKAQASKLSVEGVSSILEVQSPALKDFLPEPVTDALEQISKETQPDFILIGATKRGKEVAPRLAVRLKLGCITDAQKLRFENSHAMAERLVWGGNAISTVSSKAGAVITIAPRAYEKAGGSSSAEIKTITNFVSKTRSSNEVGRKPKESGQVNIKDAEAVVSAGRGFKKKEDLALLDELAETLHAVIGASRPLTSDLGWMPESRQVGLSGSTVKPKLYVAVGISGQIQHLTGMRDSKLIVAINSDKNAPIFQECDYGVVGDLYQVVPALTKALKTKTGH
jgi:electron transfer flavoprotein alpha subunit